MATATFGSPIRALEGETKTLATTAGYVAVKPNFHEVKLYCASAWRMALGPQLLHCLKYDTGATTWTDYSAVAKDRLSTTDVVLDAMGADDYLYLGTSDQVLGYYFDMDATNVNTNAVETLDVEYCSTAAASDGTAIAFTDVSGDADGTNAASKTLAQDGDYVFTLPTAQVQSALGGTTGAPAYGKCWWIRFKPAGALSAAVQVNNIIPIYKNTNYDYMEAGMEYQFSFNTAAVGGFSVLSIAGTPTLNISWIMH